MSWCGCKKVHNTYGTYVCSESDGANGNCNGQRLLDVREAKSSAHLTNTCPRSTSVCTQLAYRNKSSGVIEKVPCVYKAVRSKNFTYSPNDAPASLSCEAPGVKLIKMIHDMDDEEKQEQMIDALRKYQYPRPKMLFPAEPERDLAPK